VSRTLPDTTFLIDSERTGDSLDELVGRPRGAHDLIIAATARATRRMVVTADTSAFADLTEVHVQAHR
jgi:predicted nucleic acid-binding protein